MLDRHHGKQCLWAAGVDVEVLEHTWGEATDKLGLFDVVVACDVMYIAEAIPDLEKTLRSVTDEMNKARKGGQPSPELMKKFHQMHEQKKEFVTEERTGFVWLLLQK